MCRKTEEVDLTLSPERSRWNSVESQSSPAPWLPHLGLDKDDEQRLLHVSTWLNDKIVNASQRLLKDDHPHISGLQNTLLGENLSFSPELDECVQVLHNESDQWLCVTTIGCCKGEVTVLDSLYSTPPIRVVKQVAALLHPQTATLTLNFADICQQKGTADCGLYAIAFATALCKGIDPTTVSFDQSMMRTHLWECLEKGHIEEFPSERRKVDGTKMVALLKVKLCCYCRQPETRQMVRCHCCTQFFHPSCISDTKLLESPSFSLCRNCTSNSNS